MSSSPQDPALQAALEAEHRENLARFENMKARSKKRGAARQRELGEHKDLVAQAEARKEFFKAKGYKRYVDSRGRELWLLPQEYDFRVRARKAREAKKGKYSGAPTRGPKEQILLWVALVGVAVAVGLALVFN